MAVKLISKIENRLPPTRIYCNRWLAMLLLKTFCSLMNATLSITRTVSTNPQLIKKTAPKLLLTWLMWQRYFQCVQATMLSSCMCVSVFQTEGCKNALWHLPRTVTFTKSHWSVQNNMIYCVHVYAQPCMCIYVHAHVHVSVWLCVYLVMCVGVCVWHDVQPVTF